MLPRHVWLTALQALLALAVGLWVSRRRAPAEPSPGRAWLAVGLVGVAYGLWFWLMACARVADLTRGAPDLPSTAQALWKIGRGESPIETIFCDTHTLRLHFTPLWYALALPFKALPSLNALMAMATVSVVLAYGVAYALAERVLGSRWLALALAMAWLMHPLMQLAQLAPAHAEHFDLPFLLAVALAVRLRRWGWAFALLPLALSGKEDAGLYVAGLGGYAALALRAWLPGLALAAAGLAWSFTAYLWVMPHFGPDTQQTIQRWSHLGATPGEILRNALWHPLRFAGAALSWPKVGGLFEMVGWAAFLPLFAGWALAPLGMALAFKTLTDYPAMYEFRDQYPLHVMPFLLLASVEGAAWLLRRGREGRWGALTPFGLACAVAAMALLAEIEAGHTPLSRRFDAAWFKVRPEARAAYALAGLIPEGASVATQEQAANCLWRHARIKVLEHDATGFLAGDKAPDYLLLNPHPSRPVVFPEALERLYADACADPRYHVVAAEKGWELFRKAEGLGSAP